MAAGMITAAVGGLFWKERVDERHEIDVERELLIEKRGALADALSRLDFHGEYRDDAHFATLGLRF